MEALLLSFAMIFVSMLLLVMVQLLRKGDLPTGCTPKGCIRCRRYKLPQYLCDP